ACPRPRCPAASFFTPTSPAPTPPSTLSLHDALPISVTEPLPVVDAVRRSLEIDEQAPGAAGRSRVVLTLTTNIARAPARERCSRSEEHTSELQSRFDLVCRLLLEKKKRTHRICEHEI